MNYTRMVEERSPKAGGWGGEGGGARCTIGCRCNRYSCPIRAFMAGLRFERAVQADLFVEGDFRAVLYCVCTLV